MSKCTRCKKEVSLTCSCGYCIDCQAIEHELGSRCKTINPKIEKAKKEVQHEREYNSSKWNKLC